MIKEYGDDTYFTLTEKGRYLGQLLQKIREDTATEEEKEYCRKTGVYPHKK